MIRVFTPSGATQLKRKKLDEPIAAAVLGHAHGGITYSRYGKDHAIVVLRDEGVQKIAYGLEAE